MNWYEQQTNEYESITGKQILKGFGAAGYGAYIILKQIIGQNMNDDPSEWGYVSKTETITSLAEKCGLSEPQFRLFITFCDDRFILEKRDGRLFMPSILEEKNNYIKKVERKKKNTDKATKLNGTDSTYSTDKVDMDVQSDVTTTNYNYKPQLHIKKEIKEKRFSRIEDLTPEVLTELATELRVSLKTLEYTKSKMKLYLEANGKSYKNYKAAMRNWITDGIEKGKIKTVAPQTESLSDQIARARRENNATT